MGTRSWHGRFWTSFAAVATHLKYEELWEMWLSRTQLRQYGRRICLSLHFFCQCKGYFPQWPNWTIHKCRGDAAHGDGVYLTTLEPSLGRDTVTANNWDGAGGAVSQSDKMECYFEILLPRRKLRRARERRDIQIYSGNLVLSRYKWSVKKFDGGLVATQHYMVSSQGQAAVKCRSSLMGQYTLCQNAVSQDDTPVYKHKENSDYISRSKVGKWCVGPTIGHTTCILFQRSEYHLSPNKTKPWFYSAGGKLHEDETLKVFPCY